MKRLTYNTILILLFLSCNNNAAINDVYEIENDFWLISMDEVANSFENRDEIKSIDSPEFIKVSEVNFIFDHELVYSVKENDIVKIYPIKILASHEIVNDSIDNKYFAITYCPKTRSGLSFNREINGKVTEFGVSGMLYKNNLMPYDRNTKSVWSQMLGLCVSGKLIGTKIEYIPMITIKWETIKTLYPDALVLKHDNYDETCNFKSEGNGNDDNDNTEGYDKGGLFMGAIFGNKVELYNYQSLKQDLTFSKIGNMMLGSQKSFYISSFQLLKGKEYVILSDELPLILSDSEGNKWDIFGYNITSGKRLSAYYSYTASLWAWEEFYDVTDVYGF